METTTMTLSHQPSSRAGSGRPPTPEELAFVRDRRVGRLATVRPDGSPAVVPFCYAVVEWAEGPALVSPLDEKPKSVATTDLARVRHIQANPRVAVVVDDYAEDWSRLAWVGLRGQAALVGPGADGHAAAVAALRAKYPQYERMALAERPLIRIVDLRASSWRGGEGTAETPLPRPGGEDLAALVRGRRSVRAFQARPVPRAVVEAAIAAAGWAPSPHGSQPWRFAVVERPERRAALAEAMAETWRAQLELDGQDAATVAHRLARSTERLTTAPVLVVPCLYLEDLERYPDADRQAAETTMAIQSFGAAIQNFLLTIYAAGLDSGWMCAPLFCPEIVRETLGLAPELVPHALLPVGYAAKDPVRRPRRPLAELIVSWE
jgi:coenzyme F420-0:L-glutamate ligase/coenzyme F420-1:gamma-L-glutamate ligase